MKTSHIDMAFVGGLLIAVALAGFKVYMPQVQRADAAKAATLASEAELSKSEQVAMDEQQMEQEVACIVAHLKDFDTRLPSATEIDKFLKQISEIAARHELKLDLVKPGEIEMRPLYAQLPITIAGTCRFPQFYGLLRDIREMPRLTKVADLRLEARADQPDCKVEMTLLIFLCRRGV